MLGTAAKLRGVGNTLILTSAGRVVAVAAVATADLQVQQIPQRKEREEEQADESSGELGLGAHSASFGIHALLSAVASSN